MAAELSAAGDAAARSTDPLLVIYVIGFVASAVVAVVAYRRRHLTPTAIGLIISLLSTTLWTLRDALWVFAGYLHAPAPLLLVLALVVYPLTTMIVIGFYCLGRASASPTWRLTWRSSWWLAIHPTLVLLASASDPWLHVMVVDSRRTAMDPASWQPGWGFWPHTAYSYGLWLWVALLMVRVVRTGGPLQRRQVGAIALSAFLPLAGNIVMIAGLLPGLAASDLTAVAFVVTVLVQAYAVFRYGLLRMVPVARGLVFERVSDAVAVIGPGGDILDLNGAGRRLVAQLAPALVEPYVGVAATSVTSSRGFPLPEASGEYEVTLPLGSKMLDVRTDPLLDARGNLLANIVVARDVTEVHRQREQLRQYIATIERLRADLAEQAVRDELTGLHNRRYLVAALEQEIDRARTRGTHLTLVLLDLDHFKSINDTHGHDVGDAVLAAAASALRGALRPRDTLTRYGGEEFVALLPDLAPSAAAAQAEALRQCCAQVRVPTSHGVIAVTASAGVGTLRDGDTPATLLKIADEALYAAKSAGRDRLVLAHAHA